MRNDMQYHSEVVEKDGYRFRVTKEYDTDADMPWENDCGVGIVSDWVRRDKCPGELVLCQEYRSKRFYDFAGTMKKAKADGWGLAPERIAAWTEKAGRPPTAGQIREAAVKADLKILQDFIKQDWWYCGVIVTLLEDEDNDCNPRGPKPDYTHALWGVDDGYDEYGNYWREVADELVREYLFTLQKEAAEHQHWAERDVITT